MRPAGARPVGLIAGLLAVALGAAVVVAQESNGCVSCHVESRAGPGGVHVFEWRLSPHGAAGVTCERCHGGNRRVATAAEAHVSVRRAIIPTSRVHRANLPVTCGACHSRELAGFWTSRHGVLLAEGDPRAPTCTTCHGEVAGRRIAATSVAAACRQCHAASNASQPRLERAAEATVFMEALEDARAQLDGARRLIEGMRDPARQARAQAMYVDAMAALESTSGVVHSFRLTDPVGALAEARALTDLVYDLLFTP